jgi:hypothetical protein
MGNSSGGGLVFKVKASSAQTHSIGAFSALFVMPGLEPRVSSSARCSNLQHSEGPPLQSLTPVAGLVPATHVFSKDADG